MRDPHGFRILPGGSFLEVHHPQEMMHRSLFIPADVKYPEMHQTQKRHFAAVYFFADAMPHAPPYRICKPIIIVFHVLLSKLHKILKFARFPLWNGTLKFFVGDKPGISINAIAKVTDEYSTGVLSGVQRHGSGRSRFNELRAIRAVRIYPNHSNVTKIAPSDNRVQVVQCMKKYNVTSAKSAVFGVILVRVHVVHGMLEQNPIHPYYQADDKTNSKSTEHIICCLFCNVKSGCTSDTL